MSTEYNTVLDLPKACRQAVYDTLLVLADSKHLLGLRYGEWLCAPVLESSIAASAMAQDEFGHSRLFYTLVDEFEKVGITRRAETASEYRNIEILDQPFAHWPDFIAANALVDLALIVQLTAFRDSSFIPLKRLVPKLIQEEQYHVQHAKGWILQLAHAHEKAKVEIEKAMKKIWSSVLCWFGQKDSDVERLLVEFGIQNTDCDGLRCHWVESIGPLLEQSHLDLPFSSDAITGEWLLGTELSWAGWIPNFRRFSRSGPDRETFKQIEYFSAHEYPVG